MRAGTRWAQACGAPGRAGTRDGAAAAPRTPVPGARRRVRRAEQRAGGRAPGSRARGRGAEPAGSGGLKAVRDGRTQALGLGGLADEESEPHAVGAAAAQGLCAPAALPGSPAPVPQSGGRGGCGWDTCSGVGKGRDAPRRGSGPVRPGGGGMGA